MRKLGVLFFYGQFVIFLVLLIILVLTRQWLDKSGWTMFVLFMLYTTGLPSVISILVLLTCKKK